MADLTTWGLLILGKLSSTPVILWGHGKGSIDKNWKNVGLRKCYMRLAKANIFYTSTALNFWQRYLKPSSLFVAPNSLDTQKSFEYHKKFNSQIHTKRYTIFFSGRLTKSKNILFIIDIANHLKKNFPMVHVFIVGDGPMRASLENKVKDLGLTENVSFYGNLFDEEELAKLILQSYITLLPNNAGLSIQHSMGYGTPAIIGDDFNNHGPEAVLVKHNVTGKICTNNNMADFINTISNLFNDTSQRKYLSLNSIDLIKNEFSVEKMSQGFQNAIDFATKQK